MASTMRERWPGDRPGTWSMAKPAVASGIAMFMTWRPEPRAPSARKVSRDLEVSVRASRRMASACCRLIPSVSTSLFLSKAVHPRQFKARCVAHCIVAAANAPGVISAALILSFWVRYRRDTVLKRVGWSLLLAG